MYECRYCGRNFDRPCSLGAHEKACKSNPEKNNQNEDHPGNCRYCGKLCKNDNSLRNHERLCKENPNRQVLKSNFIEWNEKRKTENIKGENQYTKAKRLGLPKPEVSMETKEKLRQKAKNRRLSDTEKQKISEGMKRAVKMYPYSYSAANVNGRVKTYDYNSVKLSGLWEVEFAKYLDNNNIPWEKPEIGFEYQYKGNTHLYYPDFYLNNFDRYVEVKGYKRDKDEYKWVAVKNLIVIGKKEINEIRNNKFNISDKL